MFHYKIKINIQMTTAQNDASERDVGLNVNVVFPKWAYPNHHSIVALKYDMPFFFLEGGLMMERQFYSGE